jgi:hypothetical protein
MLGFCMDQGEAAVDLPGDLPDYYSVCSDSLEPAAANMDSAPDKLDRP